MVKGKITTIISIVLPIIGILCIILFASTSYTKGSDTAWQYFLQSLGILIIIGLTSLVSGGLFGFLFGIPKSNDLEQIQVTKENYRSNTNLEQISDWLTKILIGAALVQFKEIGIILFDFSEKVTDSFTDSIKYPMFIFLIIIYFLVIGFVNGYLATTIVLQRILNEDEQPEENQPKEDEPVVGD